MTTIGLHSSAFRGGGIDARHINMCRLHGVNSDASQTVIFRAHLSGNGAGKTGWAEKEEGWQTWKEKMRAEVREDKPVVYVPI